MIVPEQTLSDNTLQFVALFQVRCSWLCLNVFALALTMLTDAWRCALEDLAKGVRKIGRSDSTCNVGQLWQHARGPIAAAVHVPSSRITSTR